MKKLVLSKFVGMWPPTIVLLMFLTLFVGVIIWVYRKESKNVYNNLENLPLGDGERYE